MSVFGSSAPEPGSEDYAVAREVGRLLAEAGVAVQTGGYSGTMAGVSEGAHAAGGHVIGVTSDRMEAFRPVRANPWVTEEVRHRDARGRLMHLVETCDGALVLPGGPGTLAEFSLLWSLILVRELPPRPIVVLGEFWSRALEGLLDPRYVTPASRALFRVATEVEPGVAELLALMPAPGP